MTSLVMDNRFQEEHAQYNNGIIWSGEKEFHGVIGHGQSILKQTDMNIINFGL